VAAIATPLFIVTFAVAPVPFPDIVERITEL